MQFSRDDSEFNAELDLSGLICPMPILKTRKALKQLQPGDVLKVLATDKASLRDMPEFCKVAGHDLIRVEQTGSNITFFIRCG